MSFSVISNLPAYDIVGTWSQRYLGVERLVWPLLSADNMRLNVARLREVLRKNEARADLIFVIRPGNPAAVGASAEEWKSVIQLCLEKKIRLVNDAAYAGLAQGGRHVTLASVAKDFPQLEWLELYSVSKSFNDPGARLGALIGSADFVDDFIMIKGNTDSGPVPSVMAAYGTFLQQDGAAAKALSDLRALYQKRLDYVIPKFKAAGLKPACETEAGFFTLWKVPSGVLGIELAKDPRTKSLPAHEAFNRLVIAETGIVGVHFEGFAQDDRPEPLIRYAVCTDVLDPKFQERFEAQLKRLAPQY
jgi:aspartate/methionine/tyrosine aminotransferase